MAFFLMPLKAGPSSRDCLIIGVEPINHQWEGNMEKLTGDSRKSPSFSR
ncbi:MAG: hypothetical protein ABRQ37_12315 [Candidatus Eremiobacterota bacterium]